MVSKLEEETRRLIALKFLASSTGSFSQRADRKFETTKEELGSRLKQKKAEPSKDSGLSLVLGWNDKNAIIGARKIRLAIEEFKQKYPDYGQKLQELIDLHRSERRAYLEFGGDISDEIYIGIIQEILGENTSYESATGIYKTITDMGRVLGRDRTLPQRSLLSE